MVFCVGHRHHINSFFDFQCRTQTTYSVFFLFLCRTQTTHSVFLAIFSVGHRQSSQLFSRFSVSGTNNCTVIFEIMSVGRRHFTQFFSGFSVSDTDNLLSYFRDFLCRAQTTSSRIFEIVCVGHRHTLFSYFRGFLRRTRRQLIQLFPRFLCRTETIYYQHSINTTKFKKHNQQFDWRFRVGHRHLIKFFSRFSVSETDTVFGSVRVFLCRAQTTYSVIFAIFCVGHRQLIQLFSRFFVSDTDNLDSIVFAIFYVDTDILFGNFRDCECVTQALYSVISAVFCVGHRQLIQIFSRFYESDTDNYFSYFHDFPCRTQCIQSFSRFSVSDADILFGSFRDFQCRTQRFCSILFAIVCVGRRHLIRSFSRFSVSDTGTLFSYLGGFLFRTQAPLFSSVRDFLRRAQENYLDI